MHARCQAFSVELRILGCQIVRDFKLINAGVCTFKYEGKNPSQTRELFQIFSVYFGEYLMKIPGNLISKELSIAVAHNNRSFKKDALYNNRNRARQSSQYDNLQELYLVVKNIQ